jgi:mannose-1-phosphate guanylyltransferase
MNLISSKRANIHDGFPKQYLKLTSDRTLLQPTTLRPSRIAGATAPIVVTNNEQRFLLESSFGESGPGRLHHARTGRL